MGRVISLIYLFLAFLLIGCNNCKQIDNYNQKKYVLEHLLSVEESRIWNYKTEMHSNERLKIGETTKTIHSKLTKILQEHQYMKKNIEAFSSNVDMFKPAKLKDKLENYSDKLLSILDEIDKSDLEVFLNKSGYFNIEKSHCNKKDLELRLLERQVLLNLVTLKAIHLVYS